MDGAEWLRAQLTSLGCGACGRSYGTGQIRILAQREELFFVDLGCQSCGTRAVAVVTIQEDDEPVQMDPVELNVAHASERPGQTRPAVSADEVLDMHEFLAAYEGDIETLLGRSQDGAA
jgi:hypothetical protein